MAEYKELERSLLARMLRHGVIDAMEFTRRVEALGYSPEDTFKMLKLEQKEAAMTIARGACWFCVTWALESGEVKEQESVRTNVEGVTYLQFSVDVKLYEKAEARAKARFYDATGKIIKEYDCMPELTKTGASVYTGSKLFTFEVPEGAKEFAIYLWGRGIWTSEEALRWKTGDLILVSV